MSSDNNVHKTQIMVALIGVLGALGAGLLANWDKVFPGAKEPVAAVPASNTPAPATNAPPVTSPTTPTPAAQQPTAPQAVHQAGPTPQPQPQVIQNTPPPPQHFISGTYVGVSTEGLIQSPFQMTFQRHGNAVTGTYIQNGMQGTIQGTVTGDIMHYQWTLGMYSGRGVAKMRGNQTAGTWGYGMSDNNGGTMIAYLQ